MKAYHVNGQKVIAQSNKHAIVNLYPCLQFAISNGLISLTKGVKLANATFGTHISRSQNSYFALKQQYQNNKMSLDL